MTPTAPSPARSPVVPSVCVVIPIFNEAAVIAELVARLRAVFDGDPRVAWSAVFVNDGSRDTSLALLNTAATADPRLRVIDLSRNFGHQAALSAGLAHAADADAVVTMDGDLQDPPEVIPELVTGWLEGAVEVVVAARRSRAEHGLRRLGLDLFHKLFGLVSDFPIKGNTGTFGLLARPAVQAFNQLPELHRFFPGLRSWVGFKRGEILYDRHERFAGTPAQTLRRLVRYALDGVFSFSHLPLRVVTYLGLLAAAVGFVIGTFFVLRRILGVEIAATGFTTIITLVLFLGGVQLVAIGVVGEYIGRIYDEVKRRPPYIVRSPPPRAD